MNNVFRVPCGQPDKLRKIEARYANVRNDRVAQSRRHERKRITAKRQRINYPEQNDDHRGCDHSRFNRRYFMSIFTIVGT